MSDAAYATLLDRLEAAADRDGERGLAPPPERVVSLPDGSVDRCYRIAGPDGERLADGAALARRLLDGGGTFPLEPTSVRPGGQAVNAAQQVHALGDEAALVGHLDHPALEDLPFEAHSMGSPATIRVLAFDGEEVLLPERGADDPMADWGVEDLPPAVDRDRLAAADALFVGNWVSVPGVTEVVERLASGPLDGPLPLVVDPGALGVPDPTAVDGFFDVLSRADRRDGLGVVLSVNPAEFDVAASVADVDGSSEGTDAAEPTRERLAAVRSAVDVGALVVHGPAAALAATRDGTVAVDMLAVDDPVLATGAGDRFSGGLACALARGWSWDSALALANACAAHFVATAETATPAALRSRLRGR